MSEKENTQNNNEHFNVPDAYFQKSAKTILNKIEWEEEMKPFDLLKKLKEKNCFIVPENYFSHNEFILENLDFGKLNAIPKINPFKIPQNYFVKNEGLISSILDVQANESGLHFIQKENNFKIPKTYFKQNEIQLKNLLSEKKSAKIFNLSFSKVAFAAAAIIVISILFSIYSNYTEVHPNEDCGTLACIEKRELLKSKQLENLEDDELYELVNPVRLEKDLNKTKSNSNQQFKLDSNKNEVSDDVLDEI